MSAKDPASTEGRSRVLFVAMLLLCLAGMGASIYLTVIHVQACQDPSAKSFCAFNENFDCDAVARSDYSVFLRVPVSVWGIFGYAVMALIALWGWRAERPIAPTGMLLVLTAVSAVTSITLGTISVLKIDTVCVFCVATYVINLALLVVAVMQARREGLDASLRGAVDWVRTEPRQALAASLVGAAVVGLLVAFYPQYRAVSAHAATLAKAAHVESAPIDGMVTGVTDDGHYWIGAKQPKVVIEEFSDYECPHCENAHAIMRALVDANPDDVRLVHRHYPLDNACNPAIQRVFHPRACAYSAIASCAGEQGKFWQANDYLFKHGKVEAPFQVGELCTAIGIDEKKLAECIEQRAAQHLAPDLTEGNRLGVRGTPTFKINGQLYMGDLPEDVLGPYLKKLEQKLEREQGSGE